MLFRYHLLIILLIISCHSIHSTCPNYCKCQRNDSIVYCYHGGLNDTHFYHILETLPTNIIELDIQAPTTRPNNFLWSDNLNRLQKLEKLTLRNCGIPALSQRIRLKSLKELDLQYNQINTVSMDLFNGVPNLKSIDLSYNKISVLPTGCFAYLKSLQTLGLSHNSLAELPSNLLHGPRKLKELRLDGNQLPIDQINSVLTNLPDLKRLELNFCALSDKTVSQLQLQKVPMLERLGIGGNNLTIVPSSTLRALAFLNIVDLSFNKIRRLQPCAFCSCNISTVILSHNLLGIDENALHIESFAHANITTLDISHNFFDHFDSKMLGRAQRTIQELDLSGNTLTSIKKDYMRTLPRLRHLHLAMNHIEDTPKTWPNEFGALSTLNLSDNHISQLPMEFADAFPFLKVFDLSKNLIESLDVHLTDFFLTSLDTVYLHHNPWDCRCAARSIQRYLSGRILRDLRYEEVECAEPAEMRGLPVEKVRKINDCALLFAGKVSINTDE